jgi:uncharacterized repeat protein (TIGR03806 family)
MGIPFFSGASAKSVLRRTLSSFPATLRVALTGALAFATVHGAVAGALTRAANTTLKMPPNPPTFGFTHQNAFGSMTFDNPIAIVTPPGETNRVFILQKSGKIIVIPDLTAPSKVTFMDITSKVTSNGDSNSGGSGEQGLLGLAFHPGYKTNRFFYVFYTGTRSEGGSGLHDVVERYQVSSSNPNSGDATTATVIISQLDRDVNHNAGDIHFGPDGYLYVAVGDEGAEHDGRFNAQQIAMSLFSGILRIDVDKKASNLTPNPSPTGSPTGNYKIPSDNPWIGITHFDDYNVTASNVRTEFYAVGLRNPFRFSFDPLTGGLWCGDVGQDAVEEVNFITKGGNYGWAWFEGNTSPPANMTTSGRPKPTNPIKPIIAYNHGSGSTQGNCVIGGVVYRGQHLSQLYGQYVFADYVSGNFWKISAANTTGTISTPSPMFSDSSLHPTAFGVDPRNGDVLFTAERSTGTPTSATIERIIYNTSTNGTPLPPTLADTGAFSTLSSLTPNAGIVPYSINVPFWSDNAIKTRFFSIPNINLDMTFNANGNWSFPTGTVWIKHFELELTNGVASSRKRIETRFIVKNSSGVYGVTYRWGTSTSNATLVDEGGLDEAFAINDGGVIRTQIWHYPSRSECTACHTPEGGFGLGFRTGQLNKDQTFSGGTQNQIQAYSDAGYFVSPSPDPATLLVLAAATNTSASLEFRSRSFLAANCSQCHQPGGSAVLATWDARIETPITSQGIINGSLVNNLGDANNRVVTPLDTAHSVMLSRISTRGAGTIQMPPLDSNLVDTEATGLLTQWINSMTAGFWVSPTPYSQTISAGGASTTFTINSLDAPSFTGNVSLSVSGMPSGMSANFSATSINPPATSTLTVTADGTTAPGVYTLTITGTGSTGTDTDTVVVKVTGSSPVTLLEAESLAVATNGATVTLNADTGASGGAWMLLNGTGTGQWMEYTTPSLGAGSYQLDYLYKLNTTRGIVGVSVDGGSTLKTIDENAAIGFTQTTIGNVTFATGTHKIRITVTGSSGTGFTASADAFRLTFQGTPPPPTNFSLTVSPSSQTVTAGGAGTTYTVNSTATNFSSSVTLSVSGLPSGASGGFSPNPITPPQSSTLTVTADGTTAPGSYPITITGVGGGLTRTAPATLVVVAAAQTNFTLSLSPTAQSITAGGANIGYSILSTATNFSSAVTLSVGSLPAGMGSSVSPNPITPPQSSTLTITASSNTVPGTYPLSVTGTGGGLTRTANGTVTVTAPSGGGLPAGWNDIDIGAVGIAGSASFSSGTFTVKGSGSDIWTTGDQFNYAYQNVSGDQTVIARVATEQLTASFAKAGVMIRESLTTNSVEVSVLLTPTNGVSFQIRPTTGAASINISGWVKGPVPPYWVKLVRTGNSFTGFSSTDGVTWTQVGSTNVTMAAASTAGLAVTAHNNAALNTSTFDNVSISTPATTVAMEAENMPLTVSGATSQITTDANASGGAWLQINSDGVGDFADLTTPSLSAGTYQIQFTFKFNNTRGQHTVSVDGAQVGGTIDQYAATASYTTVSLGSVTFSSAGTHVIHMQVTGKNSASSNFLMSADKFTFIGQ